MIVSKGNIVFKRITRDDIELLRTWRNSVEVSQFMEYREYITPQMQEKWFKSVDNFNNLYFIIEYKGERIGLVNGKNIDWDNKSMEAGIFIASEKFLNTEVPLLSVLIFSELGVVTFGLEAYAHILKSNKRAVRYNKFIGFKLCDGQEDVENQLYKLSKESYLKKAKFVRSAFYKLSGIKETIVTFEEIDVNSGFKDFLYEKLDRSKIVKTEIINGNSTLYFKSNN